MSDESIHPGISKRTRFILLTLVHCLCLAVYLIPICTHPYEGSPVLDELHIVSPDNHDVQGDADVYEVFINDYWGRPMTSTSSHKSWRPLTVLSFRWFPNKSLFWHRVVNVVTHAATGELVSIAACLMFPSLTSTQTLVLKIVSKLVFCLHPTHVEVTANAANRPHLLAVLCSSILIDPRIHILWILVFHTAGLLCSETFLFQTPAILVTMTVIAFQQTRRKNKENDKDSTILFRSVMDLIPRYVLILILSFGYVIGRHVMDTLSIPDGLIRPAENPFYVFEGMRRVRNYMYVLSIHVCKSATLDFVGFSHEYGFECLRELEQWSDARILVPLGIVAIILVVTVVCLKRGWLPTCLWLFHLSWLATLFPISGFVKVGTFVADRIVVASTVSFSILMGRFASTWIVTEVTKEKRRPLNKKRYRPHMGKTAVVVTALVYLWIRVHNRSMEWMDSVPLLQSSLKTCPRSAKSNLEMSKVHSGLYPEMFNLTRSRQLLGAVESIDPNYCDVHQQFAHIAIKEGNYLEFEERLLQGVMCPYTMGGSVELWRRYWQVALNDPSTGPAAKVRYDKYNNILEKAIAKEREKERQNIQQ